MGLPCSFIHLFGFVLTKYFLHYLLKEKLFLQENNEGIFIKTRPKIDEGSNF